jgi:hypothetical protein
MFSQQRHSCLLALSTKCSSYTFFLPQDVEKQFLNRCEATGKQKTDLQAKQDATKDTWSAGFSCTEHLRARTSSSTHSSAWFALSKGMLHLKILIRSGDNATSRCPIQSNFLTNIERRPSNCFLQSKLKKSQVSKHTQNLLSKHIRGCNSQTNFSLIEFSNTEVIHFQCRQTLDYLPPLCAFKCE